MGPSVLSLCHNIFTTSTIPPDLNRTYLCLIPKFENGNNIKNIRPIGLCNTVYKLVTKVIVNRIKPLLDKLIGPYQASFLKNRRAADCAIIVQEVVNHYQKMKGSKANMILKVDFEKAFDRLEWSFIHRTVTFF